jgi:hypothetical protein
MRADPTLDLLGGVASGPGPEHRSRHVSVHEPMDTSLRNVALELLEGGSGIGAVEAADRHHG